MTPAGRPRKYSAAFANEVAERLGQNRRVRRALPAGGRLHVDRQLPFLCVHRRPAGRDDAGTDRLLLGTAAYLLGTGAKAHHAGQRRLIRAVAECLAPCFGGFFVLEVWSAPNHTGGAPHNGLAPAFRIFAPKHEGLVSTAEVFAKALKRVRVLKRPGTAEVVFGGRTCPPGLSPLVTRAEASRLNVTRFGLEIAPIYRDAQTGQMYPLVLRALNRGLTRALQQALFEFARTQTTHAPPHYLALGRRAVVKAVWEVDRQLAEVSDAFDLLLQATPVNVEPAWRQFRRRRFESAPTFHYRPLPAEPALLKRALFKAPLERIEDPVLAQLFREKLEETDRKITMLGDRNTPRFIHGSQQLFGGVSDALYALACSMLEQLPPRRHETGRARSIDAHAFAQRAEEEIAYYRGLLEQFDARVEVRPDVSGLLCSQGALLVGEGVRAPAGRITALLQHEVGTHLLTYYNGKMQPFKQLCAGLAGYDELQEGLAVLAEHLSGGLSAGRLRILAGRVVAVRRRIEGADFVEAFRCLNRDWGFEQRSAYNVIMRVYRSGGLTKDAVYLRGLVRLLELLKGGAALEPLFIGKINASHIRVVRELRLRQVLKPPALQPRYMDFPQAQDRLEQARVAQTPLDLLERT